MKAAVIVFPGSNCDRDVAVALTRATGSAPAMVWHHAGELPAVDLIVLPGGFSHGDYLRSGAMAARAPIMRAVAERAAAGIRVLGICNGFQILTEAGLLPGALMRNAGLKFICHPVRLQVQRADSAFTGGYRLGQEITLPIAHADGNYFADDETLKQLEGDGQVAFRYLDNPNGSAHDIAGVFNRSRTILGLMPHPERASEPDHGGTDGKALFDGLVAALG
jgi:phosphoribosylformylglycinamidine synthase